MEVHKLLTKLIDKKDLTVSEAENLLEGVMDGIITPIQTAALLTALRMKGETQDEIVGFVGTMRKHMITVEANDIVVDTCGTGGDGKGTLNISTAAAFVVAAAGIKVAKHGNRAVTSDCGSADVMEALGVNINLDSKDAANILREVGMVFLFAPLFHPATKNVVSVRKELKVRTVFNYLGPFVNPCRVKRQLIGVPERGIAKTLARAATQLDYDHILIVTSEDGTDEITLSEKSFTIEVKRDHLREFMINPSQFGFDTHKDQRISGGDAKNNASMLRAVLAGKKGALRDTVVLNTAASLYVAGKTADIKEGIPLAEESIDNGYAYRVLERLIEVTNDK